MRKTLIKSEIRANTFDNSNTNPRLELKDEKQGTFTVDFNSLATFNVVDAKFNNWNCTLNEDIDKFNLQQFEVNKQNFLENVKNTTINFDDLISSMSKPIYFIDFEILNTQIYEHKIKVIFKLNKYIIDASDSFFLSM